MLDTPERALPPHRPDPISLVLSLLLTVVAIGLFFAAFLAVYTWSTPDSELPVVEWTAGVFGATLVIAILVPAYRYMIVRCDLDGTKVKDVERALTISDSVFRHLLTIAPDKTDPSQVQDEDFVASSADGETTPTATTEEDGEAERELVTVGADEEEE